MPNSILFGVSNFFQIRFASLTFLTVIPFNIYKLLCKLSVCYNHIVSAQREHGFCFQWIWRTIKARTQSTSVVTLCCCSQQWPLCWAPISLHSDSVSSSSCVSLHHMWQTKTQAEFYPLSFFLFGQFLIKYSFLHSRHSNFLVFTPFILIKNIFSSHLTASNFALCNNKLFTMSTLNWGFEFKRSKFFWNTRQHEGCNQLDLNIQTCLLHYHIILHWMKVWKLQFSWIQFYWIHHKNYFCQCPVSN